MPYHYRLGHICYITLSWRGTSSASPSLGTHCDLQEARRSVHALRPLVLARKNLCAAMEELIRKMTTGMNLRAEFTIQGEPQALPQEWEENLLRIGQEVLTNSLRHAGASRFKVHFAFDAQTIRLELGDDGRGFDPAESTMGADLLVDQGTILGWTTI
jgi:signal transduction histidine kinase